MKEVIGMRKRNDGGVPDWAWYITWGIMLAAIFGPELLRFLAGMT